jgi:uncharacterized protein (TIGR02284 family)
MIVAGCREQLVLDEALSAVRGADRRARLSQQSSRRTAFRTDLSKEIVSLGGVPEVHASYGARLSAAARRFRRLITGSNEGDAYAACARATENTAHAYARGLRLTLPVDARLGVETEYREIEQDRGELRRLRWGASLAGAVDPTPAKETDSV